MDGSGDTEYLDATKAAQDKIDAELEKLKSADPDYTSLADRIKPSLEHAAITPTGSPVRC